MGIPLRSGRRRGAPPLWALVALAVLSIPVLAAQEPAGFLQAAPGYQYRFPLDHGSHDRFQTEWWYYTGHLRTEDGREFGYELTFFRRGIDHPAVRRNPSRWTIRQLYFAHLALSDLHGRRFRFSDKVSRAGLGKAGAESGRLHVWIDRWAAEAEGDGTGLRLEARASGFGLALSLTPQKPPVVHGVDGVSRKGSEPHETSHYYSITRLATEGTLWLEDRPVAVRGTSWMDHEFGSGDLSPSLVGWDWFSVQLADGRELMLYLLRHPDGSIHPASSGTFVGTTGEARHLGSSDFSVTVLDRWTSRHSGARYPSRWRLAVPSRGLELLVTPRLADQELRTERSTRVIYWEGAVSVTGSEDGAPVRGEGYVELTGYARAFETPSDAPSDPARRDGS